MDTHTVNANGATSAVAATPPFTPIEQETRPTVSTAAAAYYLHRRPQTLLSWHSKGVGPLRPIRVHGRLAWRLAEIRELCGVAK